MCPNLVSVVHQVRKTGLDLAENKGQEDIPLSHRNSTLSKITSLGTKINGSKSRSPEPAIHELYEQGGMAAGKQVNMTSLNEIDGCLIKLFLGDNRRHCL
jgi:hypothetical protein